MGWADAYIKLLDMNGAGGPVQFRPRGNSMAGKVNDGQLVTVVGPAHFCFKDLEVGDVVLCKVNGRQFLHLVKAIGADGRYQIGNNKGHINGWTNQIYGVVIKVED